MIQDPIVQEVRQLRAQYAASLGNDLKRIFEDLHSSGSGRDRDRPAGTSAPTSEDGSGNHQS